MPVSAELRANHLRGVTIHEICHAFVELQRSEAIMITLNLNCYYPHQPNSKVWDGQTKAIVLNDDKFQDSVNGWAGTMGEAIEQDCPKATKLAWDKYQNERHTLSATDLARIETVALKQRYKSARMAYRTLLEKWDEIKSVQNRTIKLIEEKQLEALEFGWIKKEGWVGLE